MEVRHSLKLGELADNHGIHPNTALNTVLASSLLIDNFCPNVNYNYTRDFLFLWEELATLIPFAADRARAEAILLACGTRQTAVFQTEGAAALVHHQRQ